jgi:hypothetical protein
MFTGWDGLLGQIRGDSSSKWHRNHVGRLCVREPQGRLSLLSGGWKAPGTVASGGRGARLRAFGPAPPPLGPRPASSRSAREAPLSRAIGRDSRLQRPCRAPGSAFGPPCASASREVARPAQAAGAVTEEALACGKREGGLGAVHRGCACRGERVHNVAPLQAEGGDGAEDALDEPAAARRVGPCRGLPPHGRHTTACRRSCSPWLLVGGTPSW